MIRRRRKVGVEKQRLSLTQQSTLQSGDVDLPRLYLLLDAHSRCITRRLPHSHTNWLETQNLKTNVSGGNGHGHEQTVNLFGHHNSVRRLDGGRDVIRIGDAEVNVSFRVAAHCVS